LSFEKDFWIYDACELRALQELPKELEESLSKEHAPVMKVRREFLGNLEQVELVIEPYSGRYFAVEAFPQNLDHFTFWDNLCDSSSNVFFG